MASSDTVAITLEDARAAAKAWATPEKLAWFDALTDDDTAAQIAAIPDAAPDLTDEWSENERLVIPLKWRMSARGAAR